MKHTKYYTGFRFLGFLGFMKPEKPKNSGKTQNKFDNLLIIFPRDSESKPGCECLCDNALDIALNCITPHRLYRTLDPTGRALVTYSQHHPKVAIQDDC